MLQATVAPARKDIYERNLQLYWVQGWEKGRMLTLGFNQINDTYGSRSLLTAWVSAVSYYSHCMFHPYLRKRKRDTVECETSDVEEDELNDDMTLDTFEHAEETLTEG